MAVVGTTAASEVVEAVHSTIAGRRARRTRPRSGPVSGLVYRSIREITRIAGTGIDRALAPLEVLLAENTPGLTRTTLIATLNGVIGDHLAETGNPLAMTMRFCRAGEPLALDPAALRSAIPELNGKILVLLHGLCGNDLVWQRNDYDYGDALARDLGYTPVYLHYNSGRHVSENGREFAALMDRLVAAWPVPVDDLVLVGHSMGGLVARSACHYSEHGGSEHGGSEHDGSEHDGSEHDGSEHGGSEDGGSEESPGEWRSALTRLVCLGTPHHGAPLERGGNGLQTLVGFNRYLAPLGRLGKLRSAGITDLRYGAVLDDHWAGRDRFEPAGDTREVVDLPAGVECFAMAATMSLRGRRHPLGDGLVPVASALGHHKDRRLALDFPPANTHVITETGHLDLLGNPEVYQILRDWLAAPA